MDSTSLLLTHAHLLLNHIPTAGFGIALLLFLWSLAGKKEELKRASLVLFVGVALLAIPTYTSGNAAAEAICQGGEVPGVTTHYGDLQLAGHHSGAKLIGIFQVSVLHNIIHLLFGIAGLVMARRADSAFAYLVGGGVVYLVVWIYGVVVDKGAQANFVPLNDADDWLHLVLGVGMIAAGLLARRADTGSAAGTRGTL